MKYVVEKSLCNFPAWSGAVDILVTIIDNGDDERVEEVLESIYADRDEPLTETEINDILWFDCDWIAELLGYKDWDGYYSYAKFKEGSEVYWNDPEIDEYPNPEEARNRIFTINQIDYADETAVISHGDPGDEDGYTEAEVYLSELELVTD